MVLIETRTNPKLKKYCYKHCKQRHTLFQFQDLIWFDLIKLTSHNYLHCTQHQPPILPSLSPSSPGPYLNQFITLHFSISIFQNILLKLKSYLYLFYLLFTKLIHFKFKFHWNFKLLFYTYNLFIFKFIFKYDITYFI